MNRKRNIWILGLSTLLLIGILAFLFLSPKVEEVFPTDGLIDQIPSSEIEVKFSHPMDIDSVEEFLTITPKVDGKFSWEENKMIFTPDEDWPEGVEINISLEKSAKSSLGLPLRQNFEWSFKISRIRLAYLWPLGVGANLYLLDTISGETKQLTFSKGLLDFDVDEANRLIYFSALNAQGGSDLFVYDPYQEDLNRILPCGNISCSDVQVSNSGDRLAYEQEDENGISSIWVMTFGKDPDQVSLNGKIADTPQWSPDGRLVYYDRTDQKYVFVDETYNKLYEMDNITGEAGTWSLTGQKFVVHEHFPFTSDTLRGPSGELSNQIVSDEDLELVEIFSSHLLSLNTFTEEIDNLSGEETYIEDTEPAFSPDRWWLAFARTDLGLEDIVIGRPMWIMRSDGTQQRYLTGDPNYRHSAFAWHPNVEQIALVRFNTILLTEPPEIWVVEVSDGTALRLVIGGFDPLWMP
ncbi:MAG: hypothetical protein HON98_04315 [Chloroflexi bacterium]|nr:hypothetical protein [Chloroflexota bacterium]MBT3671238.1 hypothetical protein [Chloroflexota bacterium]MBT4004370.1 hypothetical protein [Chloroflexota bacterium]MBT4304303.1 hypothetical protein [Chloroflexota bacterium]MBT4534322.1 hypothetical protein [Chloroflexota bacterium]